MSTYLADIGMAVFSVALIWGAVGIDLRQQYVGAMREAAVATSNLARALEENIARTVAAVDGTILAARDAYAQDPGRFEVARWARQAQAIDALTIQIALLDTGGNLLMSSIGPAGSVNYADREHFRVHQRDSADSLFISKPVVSRITGQVVVQFTRRLLTRDGSFAGVIAASLDAQALSRVYGSLDIADGAIIVVGSDGIVRARAPSRGVTIGADLSGSLLLSLAAGADHGTFWSLARYDPTQRLYSFRRLRDYPLIVGVGFDRASVFAEYHHRLRQDVACGIVLTFLIVLGTGLLARNKWRAQARIAHLAFHDAATGLANRVLLESTLTQNIKEAVGRGSPVVVFCIDLARFKLVNDLRGRDVGDEVLKQVARRLQATGCAAAIIARFGGDTFSIVHPRFYDDDAPAAFAQRLIECLGEPYLVNGQQIGLAACVGIAAYPADGTTADQLLKRAEAALTAAKRAGINRFRFFVPAMEAELLERRELEQDLREAIASRQFSLEYQPVYDTRTGLPTSFEALLRWNDPKRGIVSPAEFIPVAERSGLIAPLSDWIMQAACSTAMTWPGSIRVAVNLSPVQFLNPDLTSQIAAILEASGLPPERLTLEVTEGVLIGDGEGARSIMQQLRQRGVQLALDDFGTGHASLSYLRQFPFTSLKIDKSYVDGIGKNEQDLTILRSIMMLANALNLDVVAEGVETEAQLALLSELRCPRVQGFLLGRPMPAGRVLELLRGRPESSPELLQASSVSDRRAP